MNSKERKRNQELKRTDRTGTSEELRELIGLEPTCWM